MAIDFSCFYPRHIFYQRAAKSEKNIRDAKSFSCHISSPNKSVAQDTERNKIR